MELPEESPTLSPDLDLLTIPEDLVPVRPVKFAGQTRLDFSGLLDPPLLLHEDLKDGCGGQLWPAGMVLAKYILKDLDLIRGKVVLELGAGGGLVGLALAQALRSPGRNDISGPPIMITDLPILLSLQQTNIEINRLPSTSIISHELSWGGQLPASLPSIYRTPDIILAADCVYFEPAFPLLLETLEQLLRPASPADRLQREVGKDVKPVCFFCMKKRRKADMRFITTLKKKFVVQEIDARQEVAEEGGGIFLYKVEAKK